MLPLTAFAKYNYSELHQMCIRAEIPVLPTTPREKLIAYLTGDEEPPELDENDHPIHSWRNAIIGFLLDQWKKMATQITCPAKALKDPINPNPRPCFGCIDTQVITCLVQNHKAETLIAPYRLLRSPVTK
jgi:hypothetical protein